MPMPAQYGPNRINPLDFVQDYVVLNFVTTGPDPRADRIIEVGALRVRGGTPVRQLETLINPMQPLDPDLGAYLGIADATLASAPPLEEILPYLVSFIGTDIIVTHYGDLTMGFLCTVCAQYLGQTVVNDFIDTSQVSRHLHPDEKRHRLADVCKRYHLADEETNQALGDALLMHGSYEQMRQAGQQLSPTPKAEVPKPEPEPEPTPLPIPIPEPEVQALAVKPARLMPISPLEEEPPPISREPYEPPRRGRKAIWIVPAAALCIVAVVAWRFAFGTDVGSQTPPTLAAVQNEQKAAGPTAPVIESVTQAPAVIETPEPEPTEAPTATPAQAPAASPPPALLRSGETGNSVKELQTQLITLGYLEGDADGEYGPMTKSAVRAFQERNGLDADGIAGEATLAAIYGSNATSASAATAKPSAAPTAGFIIGSGQ